MNVSPEALKVMRSRLRVADERNAFLCHRRVLLDRKRLNWRCSDGRDDEMLAFVERSIRFRDFLLYMLGGPPLHRKGGFDPNQPRVPAGNSDGDQWTDGEESTTFSAAKAKGHHFFPQSLYRNLPLSDEVRKIFDEAVTGPLRGAPHGWSKGHQFYNEAVSESFDRFLDRSGLQSERLTPADAKEFISEIRQSRDPRIRSYNMRIYRQEFLYYLRRIPRRIE